MPILSGTDLSCLRGERLVFRHLDFRVEAGGALVLLGPNGSGKSSLLRLMAGLLPPFSGRLDWDGGRVSDDPDAHRARVHYVGHLDAVKPVLSAHENLSFWAAMGGAEDPGAAARQALGRLGLAGAESVPGRFLSAGQKRRLGLARLLASPRPVWLLDEPTVALDREAVGLLEAEIARHRAGGGIAVVSTHADIALPGAGALHLDRFAPAGGPAEDGEEDAGDRPDEVEEVS